ncbi:MAG: hypothetical protein AAFV29_21120, partial [Myxococcota bacterium]
MKSSKRALSAPSHLADGKKPHHRSGAFVAFVGLLLSNCTASPTETAPSALVIQGLEVSTDGNIRFPATSSALIAPIPENIGITKAPGLVLVDVFLTSAATISTLAEEGFEPVSVSGRRVSGWMPASDLERLEALSEVESVERSERVRTNAVAQSAYVGAQTGTFDQAVSAHAIDAVREAYKLDGRGVEVCIISTS